MIPLHALPLSQSDLFSFTGNPPDFAAWLSKKTCKDHVRFTSDGRNALYDILASLPLKKTDEVLLPAYTCKVLENVVRQFCKPVFADVDDAAVLRLDDARDKITRRTKALILVHPYGVSADASAFSRLCQNEDVVFIEDLAQSFGGVHRGKPLGSFGDYSFCSFRFSKDISCLTGGAVLSNEPLSARAFSKPPSILAVQAKLSALLAVQRHAAVLAQKAFLRLTSAEKRQSFVRHTAGLSGFQTGLLHLQAVRMPDVLAARKRNAAYLRKHLPKGVRPPNCESTHYRFPIQTPHADALQRFLLHYDIAAERMYDYALAGTTGAQAAARQTLCIPVHYRLEPEDVNRVAHHVNEFLEKAGDDAERVRSK